MASRNVTAISKKLAGLLIALLIFPSIPLVLKKAKITTRKGKADDN